MPKASDLLMSGLPSGDRPTNFYWDDWALSGLLKPGGSTLTLGLAGGTGPRRLAAVEPRHTQTGVDLDTTSFQSPCPRLEVVRADAFHYLSEARRNFDTVWVDLYTPHGILPQVLAPDFLDSLRRRLNPRGVIFLHLFRPENRFYRYSRALDPFEPLFASVVAARGFRADVFDHYASQTWVLAEPGALDLRGDLDAAGARLDAPSKRWLTSYMLKVLRRPKHRSTRAAVSADALLSSFHAPVPGEALAACGLSPQTGVADLNAWSEEPERLISLDDRVTPANRLRWETMAMWLTGIGLSISPRCLAHLERVAQRHADTQAPEFEWRRPLLPAEAASCV